jgi:hypothetical protein
MAAPYDALVHGFDVSGHAPVLQPMNFQYAKPSAAPIATPSICLKYGIVICTSISRESHASRDVCF